MEIPVGEQRVLPTADTCNIRDLSPYVLQERR